MSWIKNGTVNVTENSDIVTGNGTTFNSSIRRGDILVIDGLNYEIDNVVNSRQIKLAAPYPGPTALEIDYGVVRTGATTAGIQDSANRMINLYSELLEDETGNAGSTLTDILAEMRGLRLTSEATLAAILAGGTGTNPGGGTGTPTPTPAPAFTSQPSITPNIGPIGTTYTATPGQVSNGTVTSRAWLLGGTSIGSGLTVTPTTAGTLTYQETATGAGGTVKSNTLSATVSNPSATPAPVFTSQPTVSPSSGAPGTVFTATAGVVTGGTITSRVWQLNGATISTGLTATPAAIGTLTYRETATGTGGTTQSAVRTLAVTSGGTVPQPEPENPGDIIDLTPTGGDVFFAQPDDYTPLNLNIPADSTGVTLTRAFTDSELRIRAREETTSYTPVAGRWRTSNITGPFAATGEGVNATSTMYLNGTAPTLRDGNVLLGKDQYLASDALGLQFVDTGNPATTLTPHTFTYSFKGVTPSVRGPNGVCILGDISGPDGIVFSFGINDWGRSLNFSIGRPGFWESIHSDEFETDLNGANHLIEFTYTDDPNGPGGTFTFKVDGVAVGGSKTTSFKPKVSPGCFIEVNSSQGNTINSVADLEVEYINVSYGKPVVTTNYVTVSDGAITAAKLNMLSVDAIGVTTTQPSRKLTYKVGSQAPVDVNIVVGEPNIAETGTAYKAVLEDWTTGSPLPHPNALVMTRVAAQNVEFEDLLIGKTQGKWTEVLPQGPVPILDGIRYGCEGIRQGNYVVFQFHYSLDRPSEPFGSPEGLNTYMRPHKWAIYDKAGTLIERIEQPDGKPLNPGDTTPIWEGSHDGLNAAMTTDDNLWYPHGTVRSSIMWRNGTPPAYDQAFINQNLPVFDIQVPYASHSEGSVNGFDLRIYAGTAGTGQSNGFGNWKLTPWKWGTYNYQTIQTWAQTTKDPYKNPYKPIPGLSRNAALWLEYTPFNSCGRSPIVAPGGNRDDRQIIPEPVAQYMSDVNGVRRHDDLPLRRIAFDYMTSYASDAYHGVERGKLKPLYKGQPRRGITLREHYYGYGDAAVPADSAFYVASGRLYETVASLNPTTVPVPSKGADPKKPYFGWFAGDQIHGHQFPAWGSMLWKDPTFAMIQIPFSDVCRMYESNILGGSYGVAAIADRAKAWLFLHAALLWKTGSKTSSRLYSRDEILEWVVPDFEDFSDRHLTATPSYLNPPTNVIQGGEVNGTLATYAAAQFFGPVRWDDLGGSGLGNSAFQVGYWLSALHAAHKMGFLEAIRAKSAKAGTVVDFMINMNRKRVVGMLNGGMLLNPLRSDYEFRPWPVAMITTAGGNVGGLPQSYGAAATTIGPAPSWDTRTDGGQTYSRDGQAMAQLLQGPSLLLDMGLSGADLDQAHTTATAYRQSKIDSEDAKPIEERGSGWFVFDQTTNMPVRKRA